MNESNQSLEVNLEHSEKRAHLHWYQDGLAETAVGIYFLLLALLFYTEYAIGVNISALGLPIIVIGGVFAIAPIVRLVKARLTYPRTGLVSYNEPPASRRLLVLGIGLAVGIAVGVLVATQRFVTFAASTSPSGEMATFIWLPLAQAAVLAIVLGYMAHRFELARYYTLAAISLVAGIVIVVAQLGAVIGMAVYLTVMGLALVVSGLTTLRNFLRQTRPHQEEA